MKLSRKSFIIVCLLWGLFAKTSLAGAPLTDDLIEGWLRSQQELSAWGEKHKERIKFDAGEGYPASAAEMLAPIKSAGLYSEVQDMVSKYGFSSAKIWADVSVRIVGAIGAIELGDSMEGVNIQQQINEIQNAEGMSAAQKQQLIQMMQQSMGVIKQMASASDADIAAVKPHLSKIEAALEAY